MVQIRENIQILEKKNTKSNSWADFCVLKERKATYVHLRHGERDKNYFFELMYREKFRKKKNIVHKRKKNCFCI